MTNPLRFTPRHARSGRWAGALALLAWLLPALGHAQGRADAYGFTQTTGTYSAITGTVISTSSDDNVVYPATTLPFTFTYAGTAYTTLRITSNGYVTFGATAPSSSGYTPISSTTGYDGAISAFGLDGGGRSNTGAAISTATEGTAPNREFVVQYANWSAYGSVGGVENYQIRLAETSNVIRIVYGSFTGLAAGTNPQVGLRGAAATDFNNRVSAVGWDQTNTGAALTNTSTVAVSATLIPASGLTYTYTPSTTAQLPAIRPTATAVSGSTATVAFVAPAPATAPTSYTATVTPAITGSPFTVTASPFSLTGLAATTPYAVSIVANYAAGASLPTETRFVTGVACAPPTALTVSAISTTSASLSFTNYGPGVTTYTVTTTPATSTYTVSSATTTAPLVLTGLTAGTAYTVSVVSNCAAGGVATAATTTFTTAFACVTPTYAALPYTQTFENTWVSNCALREVPSLNWKMTAGNDPDASFRRYDDGAAANWSSTSYGYTPAGSNAGGASSSFSARYHSGNVSPVTEFATFDLYANASGGTGTPTLTFDYINTSGSDKIEVLLSTDGGTTFGAPLFTQVTNSAWTTYTVPLTGATATSVIRFRATGDNGSTDIGLDNVGVNYVTCAPATAVAVPAASITTTTAQVTFTPSASGVTDYTVTTSPATTQANATTSPITLTGLTPGTPYTVTLTTNCSGGVGTSTATSPVSFTTAFACVTPTYAALPYTQTFENTWVSNCALREVPSLNWKMTAGNDPDASFRRYDDGAAGNWTGGSTNYGYTPAGSNAGGASSSFSARYHSGNVSPVTEFATFDLYANASGGTGTPTLTFDYINTSGSDKIEVLLSTDGGTTFGAPLFTQILAANWTTYTVPLPGATATSVIRFRATGDNGSTDIGLDNVGVNYVACSIVAGLGVANITATTANVTFTAPSGGASYTVTYTPAGGTATTVTPAPTASPVPLTGLTPNTTYTVSVSTNCAGSTTSAAVTTTFTTACVAAPYAAVPYTQTFESTWASACGTRDVPDANWRSTPLTGNNAWRRFDDGTAGGWSTTSGAYSPAGSNAAGATSSFSARFHSYNATTGSQGQLDLYANVSGGTGTATLSFDYINTSGTDKLEVLLSTDGGTTFSTTPLFTQILAANWTTYTVPLTGATATSIIRFRATGDDGLTDIGLDNVGITYVACAPVTALAVPAATITTTTAQVTFTAPASGSTTYTVTTFPATTQANATTSPITLTGLTAGTAYAVTLTANCTGGGNSSPVTTTFTTPFACVTPTYATLPYTQTFENTWVSNCALREVPSLNWKMTAGNDPDASFRRYDDGAAGNWTGGSTNYGYTPAGSNAGGASSSFSARYHSGNVSPVTEFATFDLYANINAGTATNVPTLKFDYINTSGSDKIEVLLSTDGGATFGAPLFTQILAANWTTYTVPLTGATATSVIRFRATGDNGSTDIGLDNVNVSYIVTTATTTALTAAGVSVYPNPAHESFTVRVPAVANATSVQAELLNALGQVVRRQSAALPAAGASLLIPTTDLATGVYTLRLRAGDASLVKRVVIN
ncbi:T9SS type A sorting domain-containing protein [Hymenobacter ruber]